MKALQILKDILEGYTYLESTIKEAIKELEELKDPEEQSCETCIHEYESVTDFPCDICSIRWINYWESKNNKE